MQDIKGTTRAQTLFLRALSKSQFGLRERAKSLICGEWSGEADPAAGPFELAAAPGKRVVPAGVALRSAGAAYRRAGARADGAAPFRRRGADNSRPIAGAALRRQSVRVRAPELA